MKDRWILLADTGQMIAIGVAVGILAFAVGLYFAFRFKNRSKE